MVLPTFYSCSLFVIQSCVPYTENNYKLFWLVTEIYGGSYIGFWLVFFK